MYNISKFSQVKHLRFAEYQARFLFSKKSKKKKEKSKILSEPPANRTSDYIGPPHPTSNLRPIQFHIPMDETPTEKEFRRRRASVMEWNEKFWSQHNLKFFKDKNQFMQDEKRKKVEAGAKDNLSAKEMAVFYKQFLDENRSNHLRYNKEWYKKNFGLLLPAVKVAGIRLWRHFWQNKIRS